MTDSTFWNGEPCEARIVKVVVGKPLRPTWWCAPLEGKERIALQIAQHGQMFFIDYEDGTGWRKLTEGKGMPNYPHSSLPGDSQVVAIMTPLPNNRLIAWFLDSPDAGQPGCLCSYCMLMISDEQAPAIRMWNEEGTLEARFHVDCFNIIQQLKEGE